MSDPARPDAGPTRVMVVDDQELVAEGLATILDGQPDIEVVARAGNGQEAVDRAAALLRLDVVLMDIRMPVLDGIAATRRLLATGRPELRVVMLTTFDLDEYVYAALRAGASGFLLKRSTRDELISAVRVVAAGDALLAPSVTRRLLDRFAATGGDAHELAGPDRRAAREQVARLTGREVEVLRLVATGLSNAEVAAALCLTEHTVKSHVSRILAKTGRRDRVQAVILAYDSGLVSPTA